MKNDSLFFGLEVAISAEANNESDSTCAEKLHKIVKTISALRQEYQEAFVNEEKFQAVINEAMEALEEKIAKSICRKCGGKMLPGKGLENGVASSLDFVGDSGFDDGVTCWADTRKAVLVSCLKCEDCGWSVK